MPTGSSSLRVTATACLVVSKFSRSTRPVTSGDKLRVAKSARRLQPEPNGWEPCPPIQRTLVAAMLRAQRQTYAPGSPERG